MSLNLDLPALLRERSISQIDLSRSSGIHPSTISRACAGMELSEDAEYRIREALGLVTDTWGAPQRTTDPSEVTA